MPQGAGGEWEQVGKHPHSDFPGHQLPAEDISRTSGSTEGDADSHK